MHGVTTGHVDKADGVLASLLDSEGQFVGFGRLDAGTCVAVGVGRGSVGVGFDYSIA